MRYLLPVLFVCFTTAVPAEAQIYTWRDGSGTLVLSNNPRSDGGGGMTTYAVQGTPLVRTTTKPATSHAATAYDDLIQHQADRHGVSADLIRAVIQAESGFNPRALSPKGAMGLMQLMPATARDLGVDNPFHPEDNIRGGVLYLARLLSRYNQNVELALAAYNAGPGAVDRYDAIPPYRETRDYVKKITGAAEAAAPPPPPRETIIYKWMDVVDGRPVLRYTDTPPKDYAYEIVGKR